MFSKNNLSASFSLAFITIFALPCNGQKTTASLITQAPAAITTSTAATSAPLRVNYDLVGETDDTTSKTLEDVAALSPDQSRELRLLGAAISDSFRESDADKRVFYRGLVSGDETDDTQGDKFVSTAEAYPGTSGRQPVGPLTGRVVFCSAGHGWTNDNTSTSLWYTQRPETNGLVEDFGNLDQMNLYADICFRAGATIVPLRPIGFQHIERVIDNVSGHAAFHGEWADSQSTSSFGFAGATVPYRYARASADDTAVARFRPVIPETDIYPVYTWVRAGADRVVQTYRIVYGGSVHEVDVDHRQVANGWVYLGSYMFKQGTSGYVEVTNQVRDAKLAAEGRVVVADAIRFGNGMGDVNRGGGISGFPREEEASRYWIERSLSPEIAPIYEGIIDRNDQSNNVGAAPRFAAHMNNENSGSFFDRIYMSFHTNASGGRGVVGLYNSHAALRPDKQIELAKLTANELNAEMTQSGLRLKKLWHVGNRLTAAHINFGEIRRDFLNNEMSATILEVAFHDDMEDAILLRQLSVRNAVAESAYRATVRYFGEVGGANLDVYSPPLTPRFMAARQGSTTGTIKLEWSPAAQDPLSSPTDVISYRVFQSTDGVVFDNGRDVGGLTSFVLSDIPSATPRYFRITAISLGGESRPSAVLGTSLSGLNRALVIQGVAMVADDAALTQTAAASLGAPLRDGGQFVRLVPRIMNNGEQVRAIGSGLGRLRLGFDSVDISRINSTDSFSTYTALCFMTGRNAVAEELATTAMLQRLNDYVTSGGHLMFSGACLAQCDDTSTDALSRWSEFSESVLQTSYAAQTTLTELIKSGDRDLTTVTLTLGDRSLQYFEPRPTEVLLAAEAGRPVLAYQGFAGAAAVGTLKDRLLRTVVLGFPLEELDDRNEQGVLAAQILMAMGLKAETIPKKNVVVEDKGKLKGKDAATSSSAGSKTAESAETTSDTTMRETR